MARKQKVITNWAGMSDTDFPVAVKKSNSEITLNIALYPSLPIAIGVQETLANEYDSIQKATIYEGQGKDLANKRKEIQNNITLNGNYINGVAQGDVAILEKSGYPVSKLPEKQGILEKTAVTLKTIDIAGQLNFLITGAIEKDIKFAIFYTPITNPEANPFKWTFYYCPKRKGTITGLVSQQQYKFVSAAMGTDSRLVTSDVITKASA